MTPPERIRNIRHPARKVRPVASYDFHCTACDHAFARMLPMRDLGRVKVKFPFLSDEDDSHWARVLSAGGGPERGFWFLPEIDDEVSSTVYYPGGRTVSVSVNWSDESVRKMTTRITLWGTAGRIFADRQEIQVYLREDAVIPEGYTAGWAGCPGWTRRPLDGDLQNLSGPGKVQEFKRTDGFEQ